MTGSLYAHSRGRGIQLLVSCPILLVLGMTAVWGL